MNENIARKYGPAVERLRSMREDMGYSQDGFSDALGISMSAYGKIENFDRSITLATLKRLHDRFGISADYILFGDEVSLETAWFNVENCSDIDKMIVFSRLLLYFVGRESEARRGDESLSDDFAKFVSDIMIRYGNDNTT